MQLARLVRDAHRRIRHAQCRADGGDRLRTVRGSYSSGHALWEYVFLSGTDVSGTVVMDRGNGYVAQHFSRTNRTTICRSAKRERHHGVAAPPVVASADTVITYCRPPAE